MRRLSVFIEINGESIYVGEIVGNNSNDACFTYADAYLEKSEHHAISIGLPLEEKTFDAQRTRIFFEGLLPEGFTRRCVAEWMHMDENDYVSILAGLGRECLGAIKIVDESDEAINPEYRELSAEEVYALASEGATESAELVTKSHLSLTGASGKVGLYLDEKEDFAQALGIAASYKYEKNNEGYLKKLFDVIRSHSADPITDLLKLWDICVFNYLIGNTDNHIKNLSLLYSEDLKSVRLAPAYDIVSTIIYKSSTEKMALRIVGICNINEITRTSFEKAASQVGIGSKMAMKRFDAMVKGLWRCNQSSERRTEKSGI